MAERDNLLTGLSREDLEKAFLDQGELVAALNRDGVRWRTALLAIRDMPIPEQDNMLSANMRKIAVEALL